MEKSKNIQRVLVVETGEDVADIDPSDYGIYRGIGSEDTRFLERAEQIMNGIGTRTMEYKRKLLEQGNTDILDYTRDSWFNSIKTGNCRIIMMR